MCEAQFDLVSRDLRYDEMARTKLQASDCRCGRPLSRADSEPAVDVVNIRVTRRAMPDSVSDS